MTLPQVWGIEHQLAELVEEFGQGEGERRSMDVQAIRDGKPEVFRDAIYTHLEAGDVFLWVSHKQLAHSRMRSP